MSFLSEPHHHASSLHISLLFTVHHLQLLLSSPYKHVDPFLLPSLNSGSAPLIYTNLHIFRWIMKTNIKNYSDITGPASTPFLFLVAPNYTDFHLPPPKKTHSNSLVPTIFLLHLPITGTFNKPSNPLQLAPFCKFTKADYNAILLVFKIVFLL